MSYLPAWGPRINFAIFTILGSPLPIPPIPRKNLRPIYNMLGTRNTKSRMSTNRPTGGGNMKYGTAPRVGVASSFYGMVMTKTTNNSGS